MSLDEYTLIFKSGKHFRDQITHFGIIKVAILIIVMNFGCLCLVRWFYNKKQSETMKEEVNSAVSKYFQISQRDTLNETM